MNIPIPDTLYHRRLYDVDNPDADLSDYKEFFKDLAPDVQWAKYRTLFRRVEAGRRLLLWRKRRVRIELEKRIAEGELIHPQQRFHLEQTRAAFTGREQQKWNDARLQREALDELLGPSAMPAVFGAISENGEVHAVGQHKKEISLDDIDRRLARKYSVSIRTTAAVIRVGERMIRKLVKAGKLTKTSAGQITVDSIQAHLGAHLMTSIKNPELSGTERN